MKLGLVTKLDKGIKITSKTFHNDVMSENCDVIVIFQIYGQFEAIRNAKPIKLTFSLTVTCYL